MLSFTVSLGMQRTAGKMGETVVFWETIGDSGVELWAGVWNDNLWYSLTGEDSLHVFSHSWWSSLRQVCYLYPSRKVIYNQQVLVTFPLKKIHSDMLRRVVQRLCRLQRLRMQYPLLTDRAVWNFRFYLFWESRPPDTALGQCPALNNASVTLVQSLQNIFWQFCQNDPSALKQQESMLQSQFISECPEWF